MAGAVVTVVDETSSQQPVHEFRLELGSASLRVRELIERRVRCEVDAFNRERPPVYRGLVRPAGTELALDGFRVRSDRPLEPEAQVRAALDAFRQSGFVLLVDDRRATDLDEELTLTPSSRVRFLRLAPLRAA